MKVGIRKPSIRKSISARTKGYATRSMKRAINPTYGHKGAGWVRDPQRALYNKVYSKTTMSATTTVRSKSTKSYSASSVDSNTSYKSIPVHIDTQLLNKNEFLKPTKPTVVDKLLSIFVIGIIILWIWQGFLTAVCVGIILLCLCGAIIGFRQKRK